MYELQQLAREFNRWLCSKHSPQRCWNYSRYARLHVLGGRMPGNAIDLHHPSKLLPRRCWRRCRYLQHSDSHACPSAELKFPCAPMCQQAYGGVNLLPPLVMALTESRAILEIQVAPTLLSGWRFPVIFTKTMDDEMLARFLIAMCAQRSLQDRISQEMTLNHEPQLRVIKSRCSSKTS